MKESQFEFEKFIRHCLVELSGGNDTIPDEKQVIETVDWLRTRFPMSDDEYTRVLRMLFERLQVHMDNGIAVVDPATYKPWLDTRRADIDFFYWNRYREYLLINKDWNEQVVSTIGRDADGILDLLGNPAEKGIWKRRGLILGDVQSGKTANYTSLCNKAMDAGYRVVIVLTGTQENLRKQTQERMDYELVGLESEAFLDKYGRQMSIGVGKIDPKHYVATFTSKANDFDQKLLNNLNLRITTCAEPVLFVVKKQKQRLDYLYKWLKRYNAREDGLIDEPMLLIDDEADNASVNTKSEDSPTAINHCIRQLLSLFTRTSYVAVTATPYANIFIDPDSEHEMLKDDLFPSDFIYCLNPPSNYIGNQAYFGESGAYENQICDINDAEEVLPLKHKKEYVLETLPKSLFEALGYYLLCNAVMDLNAAVTKHRSMLINISRFNNLHKQILDHVQTWLDRIRIDVQNYRGFPPDKACQIPSIKFLRTIWDEYDLGLVSGVSWEVIQHEYLHEAISPVRIAVVNQQTGARSLDYSAYKENGLRVIAIGGISLSRGLTLEGLCVSYFYRNSQAYDTLLQMGRWFGYRPGYERLCRLWMSKEARECYSHITIATAELRDEISDMIRNELTPRDYGLMVRSHPDSIDTMVGKLLVTARNKMQAATEFVHTISVSGYLIETPRFLNRVNILENNYGSMMNFIGRLDKYEKLTTGNIFGSDRNMWKDVPAAEVGWLVREFLTDPFYLKFNSDSLADYIEKKEFLQYWDVVIPEGDSEETIEIAGGRKIHLQKRFTDSGREGESLRINGDKSRVGSRPCTKYGLLLDGIKEIERMAKKGANLSDKAYLINGRKPLLLLHFIDIEPGKDPIAAATREKLKEKGKYLTAIGLGFPGVSVEVGHQKVVYIINKVKLQQLLEAFSEVEDADD
ncbi:MAG: Z1 domain-containing protein [Syntrophomonas sp.]